MIKRRQELGLSQQQVAERMGTSNTAISGRMRGFGESFFVASARLEDETSGETGPPEKPKRHLVGVPS